MMKNRWLRLVSLPLLIWLAAPAAPQVGSGTPAGKSRRSRGAIVVALLLSFCLLAAVVWWATHSDSWIAAFSSQPTLYTGSSPTQIVDDFGVKMALVPAGEFRMGSNEGSPSERPVHPVYLDAYYIDVFEVTNALFEQFVQATGYQTIPEKGGRGCCYTPGADWRHPQGPSSSLDGLAQHPVLLVSWEDAVAYCQWRGGSLPTEAQWEKAARGGLTGKRYPWGDEAPVCQPGASNGAQFADCEGTTLSVGSFGPNGYGLYDMAGNVGEHVLDLHLVGYYSSQSTWRNPLGPSITGSSKHVVRGGSWNEASSAVRAAIRYRAQPDIHNIYMGLRCVRTP